MPSQEESFHPRLLSMETSIVRPAVFSCEVEAEDAILCFSQDIFSCLVDAFSLHDGGDAPGLPGALEGKVDDTIGIYMACFGAPAAGMLMEALIASGVKRFAMVGQAGAISPRCGIGDVFLPTWGVREEGTSYHYLSPEVRCEVSQDLLGTIKGYFKTIDFVEGGVWTTDAPFRETVDKVQRFAKEGVLAVEMECTALMAIAAYRCVEFAAALVITDHLFSGEWVQAFGSAEVIRGQELLCRTVAEGFRQRGGFT
ncbi:MAG: nucleoside phosphorylase [Anaerolineae bacterium]